MTKKIAKKLAATEKPKALTSTWESAIEKLTVAELRAVLIRMFNVALPDPEYSYDPGVESGMEDSVAAIVPDWINACFGVSFTYDEILRVVRFKDDHPYTNEELADLLIRVAVEQQNEPEWKRTARKEGWTPPKKEV